MGAWRDLAFHVLDPSFEEGRDRHTGRFDGGAVLEVGNQASTLDLRLPLGAFEAVPALLPLAVLRHVDNDCPVTG